MEKGGVIAGRCLVWLGPPACGLCRSDTSRELSRVLPPHLQSCRLCCFAPVQSISKPPVAWWFVAPLPTPRFLLFARTSHFSFPTTMSAEDGASRTNGHGSSNHRRRDASGGRIRKRCTHRTARAHGNACRGTRRVRRSCGPRPSGKTRRRRDGEPGRGSRSMICRFRVEIADGGFVHLQVVARADFRVDWVDLGSRGFGRGGGPPQPRVRGLGGCPVELA